MQDEEEATQAITSKRPWLTPGVGGIGTASFLADVGHEVPTSLMASFVTSTLGAPAAALGLIEGIAEDWPERVASLVERWRMIRSAGELSQWGAIRPPRCSRH